MTSTIIPFRRIPHQSELYLDYLDFSPKVLRFYARTPVLESVESLARSPLGDYPRREMAEILDSQNRAFGSAERTFDHIRDLEQADSVAVVTGQQVGLFTGPLYTIYKALTAIRIADELRKRKLRAVPVFWMDSEDHDLAEVSKLWVLGADSIPQIMQYQHGLPENGGDDSAAHPVGSLKLAPSIRILVDNYLNLLGNTDWKDSVRRQLQTTYHPGAALSESFGKLMAELFGAYGLVLFDAHRREAKPLVSTLFQRVIREADAIRETLRARNRDLEEAGYHTQVHVQENSTVLFLQDKAGRRALTRSKSGFAIKNGERDYSADELVRLAEDSPEQFSPSVLLRPLVQDRLFPTVAYVGGPAEVAYFGQIHSLYEFFERPMPVIWPRASFTLLEPDVYSRMERYGIAFEDCFEGKHHLVERIITGANHSSATVILTGLQKKLNETLEEIRPGMQAGDASLGAALDTAQRKILHHVEALHTKFVHLEARRNQGTLTEADLLLNHCYPNKTLQERVLGVHYFLARHGPSLLETVNSRIDIGSFVHRLVKL